MSHAVSTGLNYERTPRTGHLASQQTNALAPNQQHSAQTPISAKRRAPIAFSNLSMKDFKFVKDLGSGSYGDVQLVELRGELYALKRVNKQKVLKVNKVANVHFERDVLQAADNPYFPDFHFTFQVSTIILHPKD